MTDGPIRDEAEKLVAAAIAAVSMATRSLGAAGSRTGGAFATGSSECCVCPVCRVIAAMRDPNPDLAEKLSSGAGELAASVANLLRTFSRGGSDRDGSRDEPGTREGDEFWEALRRRARGGAGTGDEADPWHAATTSPGGTGAGATPSYPSSASGAPVVKKAMAKKAVAKKAVPAKAVPARAAAKKAAPAKAVPAKAVPKKASRPAAKEAG